MLYRFKTFRTSYYFPEIKNEDKFLYNLYHAFGGKLSKAYWWMFKNSSIVRWINRVEPNKVDFPYVKIKSLCPPGSLVSFNMGTPGVEQKISMLGLEPDGLHFFAKYSRSPRAMELSKNEISVLTSLRSTGLTPTLIDYKVEKEYIFFRTSCVEGEPLRDTSFTSKIVDLSLLLSKFHLTEKHDCGLKTCLSHGDFTPWNIIVSDNKYVLIDWELADERPLGYDIFYYMSQFNYGLPLAKIYESNKNYIDSYFNSFGIEDWSEYLKVFATLQVQSEKRRGNIERMNLYKQLL